MGKLASLILNPIPLVFQPDRVEQEILVLSTRKRRFMVWSLLALLGLSTYAAGVLSGFFVILAVSPFIVLFVFLVGGAFRRNNVLILVVAVWGVIGVAAHTFMFYLISGAADGSAVKRRAEIFILLVSLSLAGLILSTVSTLSLRTRGRKFALYAGGLIGLLCSLILATSYNQFSSTDVSAWRGSGGRRFLLIRFDRPKLEFVNAFPDVKRRETWELYDTASRELRPRFALTAGPTAGSLNPRAVLASAGLKDLDEIPLEKMPPGLRVDEAPSGMALVGPGWRVALAGYGKGLGMTRDGAVYAQTSRGAYLIDPTSGARTTLIEDPASSRNLDGPFAIMESDVFSLLQSGKLLRISSAARNIAASRNVFTPYKWSFFTASLFGALIYYFCLAALVIYFGLYRIPVYLLDSVLQLGWLAATRAKVPIALRRPDLAPLFFDHVNTLRLPFSAAWMRKLGDAAPELQSQRILELLRRGNQNSLAFRLFAELHEIRREHLFGCIESLLQTDPELIDRLSAGLPAGSRVGEFFRSWESLKTQEPTAERIEQQAVLLESFALDDYFMAGDLHVAYSTLAKLMRLDNLRGLAEADRELVQLRQIPNFAYPEMLALFGQIGELANDIKNYFVIENFRDKQYYLSESRIKLFELLRSSQSLHEPDRSVFGVLGKMWETLITAEAKSIRGPAELEFELPGRTFVGGTESTPVMLRLRNAGQSPAENVRVRLMPNESLSVTGGEKHIAVLGTGDSRDLEFSVHLAPAAAEVRIYVDAMFDDFERKNKLRPFADVIPLAGGVSEFRPIPNRYIVGTPVQQAHLFFGRKEAIDFAIENLSAENQSNVLIFYGQRRTGKSSLLYRLRESTLKQRYDFAFIDCQSFGGYDTPSVLYKIADRIYDGMQATHPELSPPERGKFKADGFVELDSYLDRVEAALGDRKLALMFDEYEYMEDKVRNGTLHREIFDKLRSIVQHRNRRLGFIFVGTHRLMELTQEYWSFLFNITLYYEIGPLTLDEARQLIVSPVADYLRYDELAIAKILRVTGAHPYFIQLVCRLLVNHCNEKRLSYATLSDVNEILRDAVVSGSGHVEYLFTGYATPPERETLAFLYKATDESKLGATIDEVQRVARENYFDRDRSELQAAFAALKQKRLVREDGDLKGEAFGFEIELLRLWIQEHVDLRRGAIQVS